MRRIPYVPDMAQAPADLVAAIRHRRGGELLNLDRMLLHSAPLARGWNALFGEIRTGLGVAMEWRELAMSYVAILNHAPYEYAHHAPLYLEAGGRQPVLEAMASGIDAPGAPGLTEHERALLQLTLEMTRDVDVRDTTRAAARAVLASDQALVEFIAVVAAYNMVSRFLVATGVTMDA